MNLEIEKQVIEQENKLPKTNITPENGNSDFFKKQSLAQQKRKKSQEKPVNPEIGETDFFKKYP